MQCSRQYTAYLHWTLAFTKKIDGQFLTTREHEQPATFMRAAYLLVYNLSGDDGWMQQLLGFWHTSILIGDQEYDFVHQGARSYMAVGARSTSPLARQIHLGDTSLHGDQIMCLALHAANTLGHYNLVTANCNHFTKLFAVSIDPAFSGKYPGFINRLAWHVNGFLPSIP